MWNICQVFTSFGAKKLTKLGKLSDETMISVKPLAGGYFLYFAPEFEFVKAECYLNNFSKNPLPSP